MSDVKIPKKIATEVIYKSDRKCCICKEEGVHIHHLKGKNDNRFENLVFLCFKHHDEVSKSGGLSRNLTPEIIIAYRDDHYKEIEIMRNNRKAVINNDISQLTEELLLTASMNAQIILEIDKIAEDFFNSNVKDDKILNRLAKYEPHTNNRIALAVFEFLDRVADMTRTGIPADIHLSILFLIDSFFPDVKNFENVNETVELGNMCIDIGFNITYDSAIYLKKLRVVMYGLTIIKCVYIKAKEFQIEELLNRVSEIYSEIEASLERPERNDLSETMELVAIMKSDLDSRGLRFPSLPQHLMSLISIK